MVSKPTEAQQNRREVDVLAAIYTEPGGTMDLALRVGLNYRQVYHIARYLERRELIRRDASNLWVRV
jgi:DNA-binding IclR family transcriptional regulator